MKNQVFIFVTFALSSISLSGCGNALFSNRATNPVISDTVTDGLYGFGKPIYGVLSTTAGRRSIFIKFKKNRRSAVCAEAPPDAVDAYTQALTAAAQASSASGPSVEGSLGNYFAVSSGLGLYRSQGLQYLRDQTFALCMMLIQDHIKNYQWREMYNVAAQRAERLIMAEMKAIEIAAGKPGLVVTAPALQDSGSAGSDATGLGSGSKSGPTQSGTSTK